MNGIVRVAMLVCVCLVLASCSGVRLESRSEISAREGGLWIAGLLAAGESYFVSTGDLAISVAGSPKKAGYKASASLEESHSTRKTPRGVKKEYRARFYEKKRSVLEW